MRIRTFLNNIGRLHKVYVNDRARFWALLKERLNLPILKNKGFCPTCSQHVTFIARDSWLRDSYRCSNCYSIPRERALMLVIAQCYPDWNKLTIHESSPSDRGASQRISKDCNNYIASHYFPDQEPGSTVGQYQCENLEMLTFADESIDLHITQDVLEHVFHPSKVFSEIARTLKPGGAHIFTVPIKNRFKPSKLRASIDNNGIVNNLEPAEYHGNPINKNGSLVTVDWGFDIGRYIFEACQLYTQVFYIEDLSKGIKAEMIEVLVTYKPKLQTAYNPIP